MRLFFWNNKICHGFHPRLLFKLRLVIVNKRCIGKAWKNPYILHKGLHFYSPSEGLWASRIQNWYPRLNVFCVIMRLDLPLAGDVVRRMVIRISLLWPYHPWQLRLFPETAPVIFLLSRCHVHLHAPPPLNTHHIVINDHTLIQLSVFHSQKRNIVFLFVPVLYICYRPLQNQLLPSSYYSLGPLMIWLKPYWSIKSKVWNDHTS